MSDQWHTLRRLNIGGSEIAALFGESPYTTPFKLWHQKRGSVAADNLDDNERVQAGVFLEEGAVKWANHKWGTQFYRPGVYVKHKSVIGMGCTPDAFTGEEGVVPTSKIAQVKIVDGLQFAREWEADGDEVTKAPLHILLQVQHEMACCGADVNWLIVLVGGSRLLRMICHRDATVVSLIEKRVNEFWSGDVPSPDYLEDGEVIRAVRKSLPVAEHIDLSDDDDLHELLKRLKNETHMRKSAQDHETYAKNELIHLYGEYDRIKCREFTTTIKPDKNGHIRVWFGTETVTI